MKRAAIVGAGFGGLALAIRLQSAGIATTVVEARDRPGGCAYAWERDGFTFDAGPTLITDPRCLAELWRLSGRDIHADVELLPSSSYRLSWPDGTVLDLSYDTDTVVERILELNAEDAVGYRRFLEFSAGAYREGYQKFGHTPFLSALSMMAAAPTMARYRAWRSIHSVVSSFVKDAHLREALSFHTLLVGGNPMTTSAIYALIHALEKDGGAWCARGGTHALVRAMVTHFERLGGTLRLGDPVEEIETRGDRVTGLRARSGWRRDVDAVAANADVVHSYRDLLGTSHRGRQVAAALVRKRYAPSMFVVHFGVRGTLPDVPHHNLLLGRCSQEFLKEVYEDGVLSEDFALYVHHPTAADPSLAPEGFSSFYALTIVPHMGKLPIDWAEVASGFADRILDCLEARLIPDLRERLVTIFHYSPADFARDLRAHLGSPLGLEPRLTQTAWFRVHNRDRVIRNLYFVGTGTHPGASIQGVVGSAKVTSALMLDDLSRA